MPEGLPLLWLALLKEIVLTLENIILKREKEGKSYTEAVIATSTKLLRTIYTLLFENRCFK